MGAKRHPVARKAGSAACVDRCTKTMMLQISFFAIVFSKIFHRRRSGSFARVVRSLDDRFGLDQEAVKTVKQWRFQPGMREGRAVAVVIEVELIFTLR